MKQNSEANVNIYNHNEANTSKGLNKHLCIVFETNTLRGSLEFESPNKLTGSLNKIQKALVELNLIELVVLVVPDIALEELRRQYIETYDSNVIKIQNIIKNTELPGIEIERDEMFDVEKYTLTALEKIRETLANEYAILTNMSMYSASFHSLVDRALEKRSPFEAKKGQSDKGFKDAILWENIIDYKKNHLNYEIMLFSKDKDFDQSLEEEYQNEFNEPIRILDNLEDITSHLISISKKTSPSLLEEIEESHHIKQFLQNNVNEVLLQYKHWIEDLEAYGAGIRIFEITDLTINNILPVEFSHYHIEGDYYALIEVRARGSSNSLEKSFRSYIHTDVFIDGENDISFEITGLTLSEED
ncbi:PIN domain-containing protein [Salinicoccus luteus]|uniref:PIN domain-containing protein n=1 Tax=Salinicoccus luteus TaxID=367840 RepID=UPI0004E16F38|nr:PIN domain-containing protein [Salinicoccus luteus]